MIDGVDVVHAVQHHFARRFEPLICAHARHRVALHEDVARGEQLQRFERGPVGPQQPL